jgi:hypothetical protein
MFIIGDLVLFLLFPCYKTLAPQNSPWECLGYYGKGNSWKCPLLSRKKCYEVMSFMYTHRKEFEKYNTHIKNDRIMGTLI